MTYKGILQIDELRLAARPYLQLTTALIVVLGLLGGWAGSRWWVVLIIFVILIATVIWIGRRAHRYGTTPVDVYASAVINLSATAVIVMLTGGAHSPFWLLFLIGAITSAMSFQGKIGVSLERFNTSIAALALIGPELINRPLDVSQLALAGTEVFTLFMSSAMIRNLTHLTLAGRERLEASEQRFRVLIEHGTDQIALVAPDGTLLYENPTVTNPLGYPRGTFLGHSLFGLIHPDDLGRARQTWKEVLDGKKVSRQTVFRLRHADGTWRWLEGTATNLLHEPSVQAIVINYRDITERRQVEEALKASESRFRSLSENSYDAIALGDARGTITYVSPSTSRILGYIPEELVGHPGIELVHPQEREYLLQQLADILEHPEKTVIVQYRIQHKEGSWRWIEAIVRNMLADSNVQSLVGNYRDITERKQAEETLREAEVKYRTLVEHIPAVTYIAALDDPKTRLYTSPQLETLSGYSEAEYLADPDLWKRAIHPDDRERVLAETAEFYETGEPFVSDYRAVTRDGRTVWLHDEAIIYEDEGNQRGFIQGVTFDITERKRVEAALQESEERFRGLSEASFEGILIHDKGIIVDANQAIADLFGFQSPQDLIGRNGLETLPFTPESLELIKTNLRLGLPGPYDITVLKPDSSTFLAETQGRTITLNGRQLRVVTMRDITDRRRAEEALRKSEELYRTLAHNFPNGTVALFDCDLRYILVDGTGLPAFGTSKERLESRTIWEVWPQDSQVEIETLYRAVLAGQTFITERAVANRLYEARYLPVRNEQGEIYAGIVITQDISERKQAEADREKLIAELTAKNAELERFTYTVSHDLKSPLVTIKGFLGYLEQDAVNGDMERLKEDSKRITNAVDKMAQLLNDLLELSRIGRFVNPMEIVPFDDVARQALELVHGRLQEHRVLVELQPDLPAVYGDKSRLIEVLQNLLDNAAKYMGAQPEPRIQIGCFAGEDNKSIFFVRDNGIGIAPEYREKIFGLFNKLDPLSEGTGIGLALVRRIIEFHGGKVWVESATGKGSAFCFTLGESQHRLKT
jgi:PAS domain S-box-containing protein